MRHDSFQNEPIDLTTHPVLRAHPTRFVFDAAFALPRVLPPLRSPARILCLVFTSGSRRQQARAAHALDDLGCLRAYQAFVGTKRMKESPQPTAVMPRALPLLWALAPLCAACPVTPPTPPTPQQPKQPTLPRSWHVRADAAGAPRGGDKERRGGWASGIERWWKGQHYMANKD